MKHLLITAPPMQQTLADLVGTFERHQFVVEAPPVVQTLSEDELVEIIDRFDAVIAGDDPFTERVLTAATRLRILVKWGVGTDAIDKSCAEERGIRVVNVPNAFPDEVADTVMAYIILLTRQLHIIHNSVLMGGWAKPQGISLRGKQLGIVGFGSIGTAVARRAAAAGMSVIATDPAGVAPMLDGTVSVRESNLEELLRESHVVSLNCNLTERNRHLINASTLRLMRREAFLVNTARGALIDEKALAVALADGRLAGAALDVFEREPLPSNSPLRETPLCVFGSHNASNTKEAVRRVNEIAIRHVIEGLATGSLQ